MKNIKKSSKKLMTKLLELMISLIQLATFLVIYLILKKLGLF